MATSKLTDEQTKAMYRQYRSFRKAATDYHQREQHPGAWQVCQHDSCRNGRESVEQAMAEVGMPIIKFPDWCQGEHWQLEEFENAAYYYLNPQATDDNYVVIVWVDQDDPTKREQPDHPKYVVQNAEGYMAYEGEDEAQAKNTAMTLIATAVGQAIQKRNH